MKGLKHAALACGNLNRALEFYREVLGFQDYDVRSQDWAMLYFRDTTLSLVPTSSTQSPSVDKLGAHPAHLGFVAHNREEVDVFWARLKQRKDIMVSKVTEHRDQSYGFYFTDTEGNQLEFIYVPVTPVFARPITNKAFVLWVHGSSFHDWRKTFEDMRDRLLREKPEFHWEIAYLEYHPPNLKDLTANLIEEKKIEALFVLPMFLGEGRHVLEDLPTALDELRKSYPDLEIHGLKSIGSQAPIVDAICDHLQILAEESV